MDIVSQLVLLSFLFAIGYGVIVAQAIALNRVFYNVAGFYSKAWLLFALAFSIGGGLRLWGFIKLPISILKAQTQGSMPERISIEQWVIVGLSGLVIVLLILAFDRHRRDLLKLGV